MSTPTTCPVCSNQTVYKRTDRADRIGWVTIDWCVYCQKRVNA